MMMPEPYTYEIASNVHEQAHRARRHDHAPRCREWLCRQHHERRQGLPGHTGKSLPKSSPWWRNGWLSAQNEALSGRIADDQAYLAGHGIQLTEWGPDVRSGKTKIYLTHYTPAAARVLYARYGCGVVVATTSEPLPSR